MFNLLERFISKLKLVNKPTFLFYIGVVILIAQRFFHLSNAVEEPMAWRQFDTEFFAYDFYLNGINLLKPSVCWLGAYKTLILEFPVVSAFIAVFYFIFGQELMFARIACLILYLGSVFYLYKSVELLYYKRLARYVTLIYLMTPFSLYYSRAVHIDFGEMFFALSMLYYFLKGYQDEKYKYIIIGSAFGVLAFLVKAPYVFYLVIPILYFIIKEKKISFFLKTLPITILPLVTFLIWESYVSKINSNAPDWFFIPGYFKFTNMSSWYFGSMEQRLVFENWKIIFHRIAESGISYIGVPLFFLGLVVKPEKGDNNFFYFYLAGLLVYLLIFFNLNLIHDYYQIPFVVITSFFLGLSIDFIYRKFKKKSETKAIYLTALIIIILVVNCIWFTERWYYKYDKLRIAASKQIRENTEQNRLVIVSIKDTDPRDPRLLAPSYRYGWSIRTDYLKKDVIEKLILNQASYLAIVTEDNLNPELARYLNKFHKKEIPIDNGNWKIFIYNLEQTYK